MSITPEDSTRPATARSSGPIPPRPQAARFALVGFGDLAQRVYSTLTTRGYVDSVDVISRPSEHFDKDVNLARYAALNNGYSGSTRQVPIDVQDVDRLAAHFASSEPDFVVNCASMQSWRRLTELPPAVFKELDEAQFGPWLPVHLATAAAVHQAIARSGISTIFGNAAFPDAVNALLPQTPVVPIFGFGNGANLVPALTFAVAALHDAHPRDVRVRFAAHHYVSHGIPRTGSRGSPPLHLSVSVRSRPIDLTEQQVAGVLDWIAGPGRRTGGVAGQSLTASSIMALVDRFFDGSRRPTVSPGVDGLVGGYPIVVDDDHWRIAADDDSSLADMIAVNLEGQRLDGLSSIDAATGRAHFVASNTDVLRQRFEYPWESVGLDDVTAIASQLHANFQGFHQSATTAAQEAAHGN